MQVSRAWRTHAQAKGQQQETQATSLTATLFGASDNGDDTSDPNSDDNKEGPPVKKMRTEWSQKGGAGNDAWEHIAFESTFVVLGLVKLQGKQPY